MVEKYSYSFDFDFDYNQLLKDAKKLSTKQVLHQRTGSGNNYKIAEEGDEITLQTYKLSLYKTPAVKDLPETKRIVAQCKRLFDAIGSKDNDILLLEYDENCFLGWHIDNPPEADLGRINIVVTDNWKESPIVFRKCNEFTVPCPAKLAVVNSYRYEHMYDNRGKGKRILLCMTTHDLNYDEVKNAVSKRI